MRSNRIIARKTAMIGAMLALLLQIPLAALAASESGFKSCSTNAHVYTKADWQTSYSSWIDIEADGTREKSASDTNSGTWEVDYLNTYGSVGEHGPVNTQINSAYYYIFGNVLDTVLSWPGCEAD